MRIVEHRHSGTYVHRDTCKLLSIHLRCGTRQVRNAATRGRIRQRQNTSACPHARSRAVVSWSACTEHRHTHKIAPRQPLSCIAMSRYAPPTIQLLTNPSHRRRGPAPPIIDRPPPPVTPRGATTAAPHHLETPSLSPLPTPTHTPLGCTTADRQGLARMRAWPLAHMCVRRRSRTGGSLRRRDAKCPN